MSELTKLKLMQKSVVEREYREKYPALAKQAMALDDTILIDRDVPIKEPIETATQLDFSKITEKDFCIVSSSTIPSRALTEELEKLSKANLHLVIRLVRLDEETFRAFYYFRQSDLASYAMVYSARISNKQVGLVGDVDLNQKIMLTDRGFHPGVIAISTFENLINALKAIETNGVEPYTEEPTSFAFRKKIAPPKRPSHRHYRIIPT